MINTKPKLAAMGFSHPASEENMFWVATVSTQPNIRQQKANKIFIALFILVKRPADFEGYALTYLTFNNFILRFCKKT